MAAMEVKAAGESFSGRLSANEDNGGETKGRETDEGVRTGEATRPGHELKTTPRGSLSACPPLR